MVFSSYVFFFYFLPFTLAAYYAAPRRIRNLLLTLLSYVFYGWANPSFMFLMLLSTLVDYVAGLYLGGHLPARGRKREAEGGRAPTTRARKAAVLLSVLCNLALLGFFKYFNFAVENYNAVLGWLGLPCFELDTLFRVTLPLGISFYTFQSMSYTIDVYRGEAEARRSFIDFACYVAMFPQLVAGPIVRFREVAEQLSHRALTVDQAARGVAFLSVGLAKKVLLANPCGKIADTVFDAGSAGVLDAWYGAVAYAFQIYFDFSGYTDMAIGLGLLLGFAFAKNFDSPYRSASITEFWRRWHISLSTWLRDYLYVPLGGNRKGPGRTYVNLALVMLLGGLWHGAAWNFVIWGGLHGALLAFERWRGRKSVYDALPRTLRVAATFLLVLVGWVFFRASDLGAALQYLSNMIGIGRVQEGAGLAAGVIFAPYYVLVFFVAGAVVWGLPATWDFTRRLTPAKAASCLALLATALVVMMTQEYNPFIYFIF